MAEATAGSAAPIAASGAWVGGAHVFPVRVYYEDTDAGGVVYHARYLHFAERARTEMLRLLGIEQPGLIAAEGVAFAVRRAEVDYFGPAQLDDALLVRTTPVQVRGASMNLRQAIEREAGGALARLVEIAIRLAVLDRRGRPARLPRALRDACDRLIADAPPI